MATTTIEVWVLVDENGDHVASNDLAALLPLYDDAIGRDDDNPVGMRYVKLTLTVPLPAPIEANVAVPDSEPSPVVVVS